MTHAIYNKLNSPNVWQLNNKYQLYLVRSKRQLLTINSSNRIPRMFADPVGEFTHFPDGYKLYQYSIGVTVGSYSMAREESDWQDRHPE